LRPSVVLPAAAAQCLQTLTVPIKGLANNMAPDGEEPAAK